MTSQANVGPQCASDATRFKARARLHQSRFRAEVLGLAEYRDYGNWLTAADALAGWNFYKEWPGLLDRVVQRRPLKDNDFYWDMLRSEHMPFNFFLPLDDERELLASWLRRVAADQVSRIRRVIIEWAPSPRAVYLNDGTSFDAYFEYENGRGVGGVGVEVKYSERAYARESKELARMTDEESLYQRVHRTSGIYCDGVTKALRANRFKQVWRNHLLGEAMVQRGDLVRFTSVTVFPSHNDHFVKVCEEYPMFLVETARERFVGETIESFVTTLREGAKDERVLGWLDYLERRYVHD